MILPTGSTRLTRTAAQRKSASPQHGSRLFGLSHKKPPEAGFTARPRGSLMYLLTFHKRHHFLKNLCIQLDTREFLSLSGTRQISVRADFPLSAVAYHAKNRPQPGFLSNFRLQTVFLSLEYYIFIPRGNFITLLPGCTEHQVCSGSCNVP